MKKIFQFDCLNNNQAITLDEFQPNSGQVVMKIHQGDDMQLLQLDREEFYELCAMRYRLDFPDDVTAPATELSLVA